MKDKTITITAEESEGRKDYCITGLLERDLEIMVLFLILSLILMPLGTTSCNLSA